ncbi:MAG: hypothetical protein PHI63_04815 [Patescibacteria group bacterium]|nr:hypothetical protein [Patescibacteria group bacterium]
MEQPLTTAKPKNPLISWVRQNWIATVAVVLGIMFFITAYGYSRQERLNNTLQYGAIANPTYRIELPADNATPDEKIDSILKNQRVLFDAINTLHNDIEMGKTNFKQARTELDGVLDIINQAKARAQSESAAKP